MPSQTTSAWTMVGPRGRKKHPDESVDEPAKLIEQEPVEIEKETPPTKAGRWRGSTRITHPILLHLRSDDSPGDAGMAWAVPHASCRARSGVRKRASISITFSSDTCQKSE